MLKTRIEWSNINKSCKSEFLGIKTCIFFLMQFYIHQKGSYWKNSTENIIFAPILKYVSPIPENQLAWDTIPKHPGDCNTNSLVPLSMLQGQYWVSPPLWPFFSSSVSCGFLVQNPHGIMIIVFSSYFKYWS